MSPDCKRCQKKGSGCWQHPEPAKSKAKAPKKRQQRKLRRCPECNRERSPRQWRWFEQGRVTFQPGEPLCPGCGGRRCVAEDAHLKTGRCKLPPIKGADVCHKHGASAPQVKAAAQKNHRQRLLDMVDPVLGQMARMIEEVDKRKLWLHPAAQRLWVTVLDRAGFHPSMKIEADVTTTDQSGWFAYATGTEKKLLLGIMEKCLGRMGGKK